MKVKLLLYLFFFLFTTKVNACFCGIISLSEHYQRSDFIAIAKILKITPDPGNNDRHDVEIELIKVYKGSPVTKLKVFSELKTDCAFYPPENSTWLIFASNYSGVLGFDYCSGSLQLDEKFLDEKFDLIKYPNGAKNFKKDLECKLEVLEYLKRNKIQDLNKYNLKVYDINNCASNLRGFRNHSKFAVYELEVDKDLSIDGVRTLKKFTNRTLSKRLLNCIKANLKISSGQSKGIPEKTKVVIIYYYFSEKGRQSTVSFYGI